MGRFQRTDRSARYKRASYESHVVLLSDYSPVLDHTPDLYLLPTLPTGVDHRRTCQTHRKRKSQVRIYKLLLLVQAYTGGYPHLQLYERICLPIYFPLTYCIHKETRGWQTNSQIGIHFVG